MPNDDFHKRRTLPGLQKDVKDPAAELETPKMIGPYKIESVLEKGGMSILYLGLHPDTREPTTIKVLLPKFLSNPDVVHRFLNEAEIIAMTDHPNIVKLYGHGEWEGGLYISMEYIQGKSLRQTMLQNPISLKRSLEIIIDIAYALCHLHTHGVIHRDLKPENILITESGEVKVIDFGIAQLLTGKNDGGAPATQRLMGTPIYMSPEQRENPENVSYPSDIYSLGIISYELVLGKMSHGQIHLSLMPKGLQKILSKTLQPRPQDRYHDVVDFITDVSAYLNSTNLDKEKNAGDQLSEISENLRNVKSILIPSSPPIWPEVEISLSSLKGLHLFGIYYDFLSFPDGTYGVVMGESSAKGAEGVIYAATIRGMVQALNKQITAPSEVAAALNKLIINDESDEFFAFSYLILKPKQNSIDYICCGENTLWRIPKGEKKPLKIDIENIALGIEKDATYKGITAPWEIDDFLILSSFTADTQGENSDHFFERTIQECDHRQPSQGILDTILRRTRMSLPKSLQERSLSLIGLKHRSRN